MANSEHASINMKKLADSLKENIETLHPISKEYCIYRVPQSIRGLSESAFTPQVVSIGPLHHGKPELKVMEEHKRRYLCHFLQRTQVSIEDFLALIKDNEVRLRNCYAETIEIESDEFITMILVDAVFLIEYLLRCSNNDFISDDDCILRRPWIYVERDIWLLENQLPLFILGYLFTQVYNEQQYYRFSLIKLIRDLFKESSQLESSENLIETYFSVAEHLLDLRRLCLEPPELPSQNMTKPDVLRDPENVPTVMELHQAGVKFILGSQNNLLDITFSSGILEIPFLGIYTSTEDIFRNVLAFESMHIGNHYLNDYVLMMSHLLSTAKDVELLIQNGVIKNWLGDSEAVSTLFDNLAKQTALYIDAFRYSNLVGDLRAHCNIPWHKWKATLKQNYFNTPWASISVAAAVCLLLLTILQAVCSIISL